MFRRGGRQVHKWKMLFKRQRTHAKQRTAQTQRDKGKKIIRVKNPKKQTSDFKVSFWVSNSTTRDLCS